MVERYVMEVDFNYGDDTKAVPVKDPWGQWVRVSDYDADLAEAHAKIERLGRELNIAKYGEPDFSWSIHKEAMSELLARAEKAEAERDSFQAMFRSCLKGNDALREKAQKANTERDEARAQVAAAFEAGVVKYVAGDTCEDEGCPHYGKKHTHPGDLTPTDAKAALEAYGREKVREGMRLAADIAAVKPRRGGRSLSGPHHAGIRRGRNEAAQLILAETARLILAEMEKLK